MKDIERKLLLKALLKYQKIYPCGNKKNFSECFTTFGNNILFWFNTEDQSTHLLSEPLEIKGTY
jgi:hypothetical protein